MSTPEFALPTPLESQNAALLSEESASIVPHAGGAESGRKLHRLAEVRRVQNVSLNSMARHLDIPVATARKQEQPDHDMLLSHLYRWQELLHVPAGELLVDTDEYPDNPIRRRSQLVKVMKTARTLLLRAKESSTKILAQTLCDQLVEIMPELREIGPWPSVGQSREAKDLGQAAYRRFDANVSRSFDQD